MLAKTVGASNTAVFDCPRLPSPANPGRRRRPRCPRGPAGGRGSGKPRPPPRPPRRNTRLERRAAIEIRRPTSSSHALGSETPAPARARLCRQCRYCPGQSVPDSGLSLSEAGPGPGHHCCRPAAGRGPGAGRSRSHESRYSNSLNPTRT